MPETNPDAPRQPILWIVTEGMAGTENQCRGIAEALGLDPVIKRVQLNQPWKTLSPYLGFEGAASFVDAAALRAGEAPDIILGSGRKAVAAMRWLKKTADQDRVPLLVQVQDPRHDRQLFDAIIVAQHDPAAGANVVKTTGNPNRMTPAMLQNAADIWADRLGALPSPRVAVVIGGNSRAYTLDETRAQIIARDLRKLLDSGAGVMITASRRTPEASRKVLEAALMGHDHVFFWDGTGDNPYMGMLALADYVLVTADSTSMLSDAGTAGKPLYIVPLDGGHKRITKLHDYLVAQGIARWFEGRLDAPWSYAPLRDAQQAAEHIRGLLAQRGFTLTVPATR